MWNITQDRLDQEKAQGMSTPQEVIQEWVELCKHFSRCYNHDGLIGMQQGYLQVQPTFFLANFKEYTQEKRADSVYPIALRTNVDGIDFICLLSFDETVAFNASSTSDEARRLKIREAEVLKQTCKHHVPDEEAEDKDDYCSGITCDICGIDLGWYCTYSTNHICDYSQDDGSYNEDSCRYCGQPEERK